MGGYVLATVATHARLPFAAAWWGLNEDDRWR